MSDLTESTFVILFKESVEKCFGSPLDGALSEADCKLLATKILEQTGLVIGPKSIRNYSLYISNSKDTRKENPSIATLDTLARYVLNAPRTDEVQRKEKESHYPYWFQYKNNRIISVPDSVKIPRKRKRLAAIHSIVVIACVVVVFISREFFQTTHTANFYDGFNTTNADSLKTNGWITANTNPAWFQRNNERAGHLTLLTLPGDNWSNDTSRIQNLMMREVTSECFTSEIHVSDFVPRQNWQQTGILISEDSLFAGKVIRLSLSYNDFFGGYQKSPEIIIQAVSSAESGAKSKPEEIAHMTVFNLDKGFEEIVHRNLRKSALKIEKRGNRIRLLFATGEMESFAFKEVVSGDFNIHVKYIGIFASQGLADNEVIPAYIDSFALSSLECVSN